MSVEQRFPPPDFGQNYVFPKTQELLGRPEFADWMDVGILAVFLGLATWLALRKRNRRGLFWLAAASVAYFGFMKQGCICPIGSIQNICLGLFGSGFAIPLFVVAVFTLPLLFALIFGRVFCSGVCPLGAVQELVLIKPIKVPRTLESVLGVFRYVYLGVAVLYASMGAAFLICKYDPFVGFFRMSALQSIWIISGIFLLLSLFVGRPYCRFLCPYGALLGMCGRVSARQVTIAPPDTCINCGLCHDACPFGAIRPSDAPVEKPLELERNENVRRLSMGLFLLLVLPLLGAMGGWLAGPALSKLDGRVQMAEAIAWELTNPSDGTAPATRAAYQRALRMEAYKASGQKPEFFYTEANQAIAQFKKGGAVLGVWCGLTIAICVMGVWFPRRRKEYEADPGACFACGRCWNACPVELERQGKFQPGTFKKCMPQQTDQPDTTASSEVKP